MKNPIKTIEAPLYLATIGLACMELGAPNTAIFLFVVSVARLVVNIIENQK